MSDRAKWQPFLRDVFLKSEGGYVKTGSLETLFGVIDRVWVDAIDRVPDAELNSLPGLLAIKRLPEGQRMGPMREWMRTVGRELHPMGGGVQPEKGQPLRSKEWVEAGGNATLVRSAQEVALGIIHRDYIVGGHFGSLPLSQDTLCTVIDAAGRYGVAAAWTMVTKSARLSGYITERQMNELGYTDAKDMRSGDTYDKDGGGGYNYTVVSKRKAVGEAMQLMHNPEMDSRFFDAYGFWRRNYVSNYTPVNEREGDMLRIEHQHPGTSAALARMAAWRTDSPQNAARADARIAAKSGGLVQTATADSTDKNEGLESILKVMDGNTALVQTATDYNVFSSNIPKVKIELPHGVGAFTYSVKYEKGWIDERDDGSDKAVYRTVPKVADYRLPKGVELVHTGKKSLSGNFTNIYADSVALRWRDPESKKMVTLMIGPGLTEYALELPENLQLFGIASTEFKKNADGKLDPSRSAELYFDPSDPAERQGWTPPRNGAPRSLTFTEAPVDQPQLASSVPDVRPSSGTSLNK